MLSAAIDFWELVAKESPYIATEWVKFVRAIVHQVIGPADCRDCKRSLRSRRRRWQRDVLSPGPVSCQVLTREERGVETRGHASEWRHTRSDAGSRLLARTCGTLPGHTTLLLRMTHPTLDLPARRWALPISCRSLHSALIRHWSEVHRRRSHPLPRSVMSV